MHKKITIGGKLPASAISLGCMRIGHLDEAGLISLINTAIDGGIDFFDHADIYGGGEAERAFGAAVKAGGIARDKILVQTKCGIRPNCFDFSKEHILASIDKSLARLGMDYVDVFLLHRPDTLMEPEEVAEAFAAIHKAGKARYFGVSNHNAGQIKLLNKYLGSDTQIVVNQLQFSPTNTGMIDAGLNVNMQNPPSIDHDGGILAFCRLEDITIQAWSPFQYGFFEGVYFGNAKFPALNKKLDELAEAKGVSVEAIVIAWILRHPAKMQAIPGSTNEKRVKGLCAAYDIDMSREEWYDLYKSAGNVLP